MEENIFDIFTAENNCEDEFAKYFSSYGFKDEKRAYFCFREIAKESPHPQRRFLVTLFNVLSESADVDEALLNFVRYIENSGNRKRTLEFFRDNVDGLSLLITIFSFSRYFSDAIISEENLFASLYEQDLGKTFLKEEMRETLNTMLSSSSQPFIKTLRFFQTRNLLRVLSNDILGITDFITTTSEISHLAEIVLDASYNKAYERLKERIADDSFSFTVIAMGKLGGEELNYSSDIDVIFIFDTKEEDESRRSEIKILASKLAQEIIADMGDTAYGALLYRIDTRLRPEGSRGELAISIQSALNYYYSRGRTWEKQAFIKARAVAGSLSLGKKFLEELSPFIYPKYLSYESVLDIKRLKGKIEDRVKKEGKSQVEVKTGYGGIRDIEFIAQFYQLLYGGRIEHLRTPNTLECLSRLGVAGIISEEDIHALRESYIFLRDVEHRLQFYAQHQTHELPKNSEQLKKIALRMQITGQDAAQTFSTLYHEKTTQVRSIFDKLFSALFTEENNPLFDLFSGFEEDEATVTTILSPYGFKDAMSLYKLLFRFADDFSTYRKNIFLHFLPSLFDALSKEPFADEALTKVLSIIEAYGAKEIFFELLYEQPELLNMLVKVGGSSTYLSRLLSSNPSFIDEIFYGGFLEEQFDEERLLRVLERIFSFHRNYSKAFLTFKHLEEIRIGVKETLSIGEGSALELSTTADIIIAKSIEACENSLPSKFPMAVIKLGKLGSRDINFGSDLDLVFVYEKTPYSDNQAYYLEAFQKVLRYLGESETSSRVYDVDIRLRPYGNQGTLGVVREMFVKYYKDEAEVWEKVMYSKARVYSSDKNFENKIYSDIISIIKELDEIEVKKELKQMREKVANNFPKKSDTLGFKKGKGSLFDADFILQNYIVNHIKRHGGFTREDRINIFKRMEENNYLASNLLWDFEKAYLFMRQIEIKLRIFNNSYVGSVKAESREAIMLASQMGYGKTEEAKIKFREDYNKHSSIIETVFDAIFS